MIRTWKLGTRGSLLARTQSGQVAEALATLTGEPVELVILTTRGDQIQDRPLAQVGGKGLFTLELEEAMLAGSIDLAVHSLKDLPGLGPAGLVVAGLPTRQDPRDVLVGGTLADLPAGARVGTGSLRRRLQLQRLRPDLVLLDVRGNVDTRVRRQQEGDFDAVMLAAAGLLRLGRGDDITEAIEVDRFVPAVGQGVLALQCREDDAELRARLAALTHAPTAASVALERAFLIALGGGCSTPVACHAAAHAGGLRYHAFVAREDGAWVTEDGVCALGDGGHVGASLAHRLMGAVAAQPSPRT